MPELAKQKSKEGLEAFAEYWYALSTYGFETGDTTLTQQNSGSECVVCENFYRMVNNGYENSDWIVGGKLEAVEIYSDFTIPSNGMYQVLIDIKQEPLEFRGPGNHLYDHDDGIQELTIQMIEATYADGQWFANNVVTVK